MSETRSTPRSRAREQTMRDIVRIGRAAAGHRGRGGALVARCRPRPRRGLVGGLPLRRSRDELLTLLVVDGYDELGDAVDAALEPSTQPTTSGGCRRSAAPCGSGPSPSRRRTRCCSAARSPATRRLPSARPAPASGWSARLVEVWQDAWDAGVITAPRLRRLPRRLSRDFSRIRRELGLTVPDAVVARGDVRVGRALRLRELGGLRPVRPGHLHPAR